MFTKYYCTCQIIYTTSPWWGRCKSWSSGSYFQLWDLLHRIYKSDFSRTKCISHFYTQRILRTYWENFCIKTYFWKSGTNLTKYGYSNSIYYIVSKLYLGFHNLMIFWILLVQFNSLMLFLNKLLENRHCLFHSFVS